MLAPVHAVCSAACIITGPAPPTGATLSQVRHLVLPQNAATKAATADEKVPICTRSTPDICKQAKLMLADGTVIGRSKPGPFADERQAA